VFRRRGAFKLPTASVEVTVAFAVVDRMTACFATESDAPPSALGYVE